MSISRTATGHLAIVLLVLMAGLIVAASADAQSPLCSLDVLAAQSTTVQNVQNAAFVDPLSKKPKQPTSVIVGKTVNFGLYDWNVLATNDSSDRFAWSGTSLSESPTTSEALGGKR